MEIPTLREEVRKQVIEDILFTLPRKKTITLWQNIQGNKSCMPVKLTSIKTKQGVLRFFTRDERKNFQFFSKDPIYFYETKRTFIFKTSIAFQSPLELEIRIPEFTMIEELRTEARKSGILEQLFVHFKCNHHHVHGVFEKKVLDYNSGGFSILVKPTEAKHLYPGDTIQLFKEGENIEDELVFDREAKIIHAERFFDGEKYIKNLIKVGFSFL